jgi:hypothetical protein
MATWDDVRTAALSLPETTESVGGDGRRSWHVRDKKIAWERPLRKADLVALGAAAPTGPILGIRTADVLQKDEILAARPDVFFTTPHFDGFPAVLAQLDRLELPALGQLLRDAWRHRAPKRLVREFNGRS